MIFMTCMIPDCEKSAALFRFASTHDVSYRSSGRRTSRSSPREITTAGWPATREPRIGGSPPLRKPNRRQLDARSPLATRATLSLMPSLRRVSCQRWAQAGFDSLASIEQARVLHLCQQVRSLMLMFAPLMLGLFANAHACPSLTRLVRKY